MWAAGGEEILGWRVSEGALRWKARLCVGGEGVGKECESGGHVCGCWVMVDGEWWVGGWVVMVVVGEVK